MISKLVSCCSFTLVLCSCQITAQDVRAATYQWVDTNSGVLIENILKLYVDSTLDANRSSVIVTIDGVDKILYLISSESVEPNVICHTFKNTLLYAGPGVYHHAVDIPYRVGQILNFDLINNIPLKINPILIIGSSFGLNSTPFCNNLQSNITQSSEGAVYTPNFIDSEGDSLVFSLTNCDGSGYYIPTGCSINSATGVITANPPLPGLYAFCTKVEEYRFGFVISTTYTDMVMQIDNVTSVAIGSQATGLSLFPSVLNCNGSLTVHAHESAFLQVFDAAGKRVFHGVVYDGNNIDLNIVEGVYMYILQADYGSSVLRGKIVVI